MTIITRQELEHLRLAHHESEDCWYSCPKSDGGCCNEAAADVCTCGADTHNATLDAIIAKLFPTHQPFHLSPD